MENENTPTPDGDSGSDNNSDDNTRGSNPGRDRDLAMAIQRRDAATKRAQKLEQELKSVQGKLKEMESLQDQLDELQGKRTSYDTLLKRKEQREEELSAQVKQLEAERDGLHRKYRHRDFVDAIHKETGVSTTILKGLLHVMKQENPDFDDAPEAIDKSHIKFTIKELQQLEPTPFQPPPTDQAKPRPRPMPSPSDTLRGLPSNERPTSDRLEMIAKLAQSKNR